MDFNFNRKYELYFGTPSLEKSEYKNIPVAIKGSYTEFDPSKAVMVNNLQFKATITRTSKGTSANTDSTNFEIYNLSKETRKYAEQEGALIILKAGYDYDTDLPILYAGQIKSVGTTAEGPNTITKIVAGDAYIPQKNARISKYYPPFVSKAEIIKDLALSLPGVGEGVFATATLERKYYNSGFSASGKTTEVLSRICKAEKHEYVIENSRVYIRPLYVGTSTEDFARLNARVLQFRSNQIKRGSGKMNDNTKDLSNQQTTKAGYKFILFLEGRVRASSFVQVLDGDLEGIYKVVGVKHTLDWRGQAWDTEIETEAF